MVALVPAAAAAAVLRAPRAAVFGAVVLLNVVKCKLVNLPKISTCTYILHV